MFSASTFGVNTCWCQNTKLLWKLFNLSQDANSDEGITSASSFIRKAQRLPATKSLAPASFTAVGLPKVDMKSPARIIEEKERIGGGGSLKRDPSVDNPIRVRSRSHSPAGDRSDYPDRTDYPDRVATPSSGSDSQRTIRPRRRSGTPASVKSRVTIHAFVQPVRWWARWISIKNGPSSASFSFIFVPFKKAFQFLQQINVKNVHKYSVLGLEPKTPRTEHESPLITTRPGSRLVKRVNDDFYLPHFFRNPRISASGC